MPNYLIYPDFTDGSGFPSEVNESIAESPEMEAVIESELVEQIPSLIDPLVATSLAKDSTVALAASTAASSAVGTALNNAGVVYGRGVLPGDELVFGITDQDGRRSWVEIAASGKPSAHSVSLLIAALQAGIDARVTAGTGNSNMVGTHGYAYLITDAEDRIAFGIRNDGTVTAPKLDLPLASVKPEDLAQETRDSLEGPAKWSTTASTLGYSYLITDAQDRIAFAVKDTGEVVIPKITLGDGVVQLNNLDPSIAESLTQTRPDYYATTVGTTPNRQIAVVNTENADQSILTTTGDNFDPIITGDGIVLYKNSDGNDYAVPVTGGPIVSASSKKLSMTMWGDSLTAAGGIRTRLMELIPGLTVVNEGIGGQTSPQIAARQGGGNSTVTVTGNTIPASGPVTCTNVPIKFLYGFGQNGAEPAISRTGTLAGVPGTMSKAAVPEQGTPVYIFTRTTPGSEVICPPGTKFITDLSVPAREHTVTMWTGRNNANTNVEGDTDAMVAYLTPYVKRFLIISTTTATTEIAGTGGYIRIKAINDYLRNKYGDRFVDVRQHLVDNGMALAGLTPTQADLDCIAGDTIPWSLMNPGDSVHFTTLAQRIMGEFIHARMISKGWV